jgi:hypothetical protein
MPPRKNAAAQALAKRRWKDTTKAERTEALRATANARWDETTEEERKAWGAKLAAARAAARKRKGKNARG